jgi:mannose-1-phosphate guanylyltransferase
VTRVALVMAGGAGERFWPLSTPQRPKQLLRLADPERTLLAQTLDRVGPLADRVAISTGRDLVAAIASAGIDAPCVAEPARRNTAGALVWATAWLLADDPGLAEVGTLLVTPADHAIDSDDEFRATLRRAVQVAEEAGGLVTIGVRPTRPETGYGYIEIGDAKGERTYSVRRFREKPDAAAAETFLAQGGFLWNSGMFFWTIRSFLSELGTASPLHRQAIDAISGFLREGNEAGAIAAFEALPSISIDYALMERASSVWVVEAGFGWDDVGAWDALARTLPVDADGNVAVGTARLVESRGCVVYAEGIEASVLGCEDLVVVVANGKVMVLPKSRAQDVRKLTSG